VTSSYLSLVSSGLGFVVLFKPQPQLPGIFIVAFLTNWLQIDLIELCFQVHLLVAGGAGKVIDAPGLIQGCEHITLDHLVTGVAKVAKKLMVVSLAESQTFSLVMPVSKEWFLTLSTYEVFHMPMFAQSCDHSLLYRPPACPTYGDAHLVVAAQTVQLVQLVGGVAGTSTDFPGTRSQLTPTSCTVEVVGVVHFSPKPQWLPVDRAVALLAHVLAHPIRLHLLVALVAKSSSLVFDEPQVSQLFVTHLTGEALCMPGGLHRLDDPANDELATLLAAGREQNMEVVLTVLPPFVLVEHAVRKRSEALGADKAAGVKELAVRVDDLGLGFEPAVTPSTRHRVHRPVESLATQVIRLAVRWSGRGCVLVTTQGRH